MDSPSNTNLNDQRSSMPLMTHDSKFHQYIDNAGDSHGFDVMRKRELIHCQTPIKKRSRKYLDQNSRYSGTP